MNTLAFALYLAFLLIALVWPSWRIWRNERINPVVLPTEPRAQAWVGRHFRAVVLALAFVLGWLAVQPTWGLGALVWQHAPGGPAIGLALASAALVWVAAAQWHMGRAWRIGIDTARHTPLVAQGVFRWSRNPIFLGMRVALAGLLLVIPDAAVLLLAAWAELLIQVQVRFEEAHLQHAHGQAYTHYCAQVGRWWGRPSAGCISSSTIESPH